MAVTYTTIILLTFGLCEAAYKICPAMSVNSTHSAFGTSNYVQRGVWHQVHCPSYRPDEAIIRVIWYKRESPTTPEQTLITHKRNEDYPESHRYAFGPSGFSLVIKGVEESDEGGYVCQVVPSVTTTRTEATNIQTIGGTFPGGSSQAYSTATFQRGLRQTLLCECASLTPDVVYWSTGEGDTTDTQIIGARFSDGAAVQIQHGADYSIGSDASLTVNSLNDVHDAQRFWCHVFQSDGTLRNCLTDVQVSDEVESAGDALKASERSFYLRKDTQQILPCLSWTPGNTACEVEWSKLGNPDRQVLSYNLSTGVVDSSPEFDLASDFGLVIQSVDDDHAGVYRCAVGDEIQIDVEVYVHGDRFPLDGGSATEGDSVTFKPESKFSLQCPALSDISLTTKATLFWSFGAPDAGSTTVIGTLNLPDGPMKMSELGKYCLGISMEGALLLNNSSQGGDVRYWCHVFPANGDLIRSYVDVLIEDSNGIPVTSNIVAIAVSLSLFFIVLVIVLILVWKRRRRHARLGEDKERGYFRRLLKQEPVTELDLKTLASKIKSFVSSKLGKIPVTPWVDGNDARFASIDTVYRPLEMFVNIFNGGSTVRYQLDSESGIFDDGIPELASKHAIIQGRRGCGKTTFLHRLIYDWAMGMERALWGSDQIVVLVPAWLLIKAKTIGEAVVECMLPKDVNISAESINAHYARDKRNLTILVDDCNDKNDIDAVMKVMTDNEFLGCQLILTTRNEDLAKAASRNHNMRQVTITGFTPSNAIEYIDAVLDAAEDGKKSTAEHKAVKSKAEAKSGSISDTNVGQHLPETEESPRVSAPPETKKSTATSSYPKVLKTTTPKEKRNLHRYLEEDILPPDISCLPAVLAALCQMSIWTKGDAFKSDVTMTNVFFRLVKYMFDRMKGQDIGVIEGNQRSLLTKDQLDVLAELGRVAYSRLVDSCANDAEFSKEDFLSSSEKGEDVLEVAIDVGLLCPLQVESKVEFKEQTNEAVSSEVSEVEIRTGRLCCKRKQKQQTGTERKITRQDTELTPLTNSQDKRVYFILEILEQLGVAVFLAQTTGKLKEWFENITEIGQREILQRFSNVLQFAVQDSQFDREDLVDYCATIANRGYSQVRPLRVVLQLQKFVELCLQLNFEGQCEGVLNKKLKSVFPDGRVCLIGISSYKLRLLSYLLKHAQPEDKSNLNVKSVELLRIGRYDWPELQEYIEYFVPGQKESEKTSVKTKNKYSQPATTGSQQATVLSSPDELEKLPDFQQSVSHPPESKDDHSVQQKVKSSKAESQPEIQPNPENQQKPEAGRTTTADQRNDVDTFSVNRTTKNNKSQPNTQQSPVPHQQLDNEQTSITTFTGTHLRNEPKSQVHILSAPDVKADDEKAPASNHQIGLVIPTETQNPTETRHSSEIHQPNAVQPSMVDELCSDPRRWENKLHNLSRSKPKLGASPTKGGGNGNEDESKYLSVDEYISSYDVIYSEKEPDVLKKMHERLEKRNQDMPRFPPAMSDINVLHIVHSFGLTELLESQAGKCYSSGAARDLARYLPRLEMLESLVLIGTILSSEAICDLAKSAHQLPNLKKLDLRLNKQFDNRAFVAVANLPLRQCKKLTDLRLSLYGVRGKGFDEVQKEIRKDGEDSLIKLKTLYLLHGSPAKEFIGFLSNNLKYFHFVERFHISATYKQDIIPVNIQDEFEQNMKNPEIMPNLEDLDIGNLETLKARLAPLKLPKKREAVSLKKIGTAVQTTATGILESVGKIMVSEIAESVADAIADPTGVLTGTVATGTGVL